MCVAYFATKEAGIVDLKVGQGEREEPSYLVKEMECSGALGTPCEKEYTRETVWGKRAGSLEMENKDSKNTENSKRERGMLITSLSHQCQAFIRPSLQNAVQATLIRLPNIRGETGGFLAPMMGL